MVEIGATWMPTLYFGQAPGMIAGIVQVNVQIPAKTPAGEVGVWVNVGPYPSYGAGLFIGPR